MCGYRDDFSAFESTDTVVLAISVDEQAESNRFKDEHKLPFAVVGDPKHEIINKYGVEILKRGDFEYAKRQTFLIDKEGKIAYIDWNYDFAKGKEPLLDAIKKANEKS
jgi:peroxiredoxin Q/BCP